MKSAQNQGGGTHFYMTTHTVAHHRRRALRLLSIASRYEFILIEIERAAPS